MMMIVLCFEQKPLDYGDVLRTKAFGKDWHLVACKPYKSLFHKSVYVTLSFSSSQMSTHSSVLVMEHCSLVAVIAPYSTRF